MIQCRPDLSVYSPFPLDGFQLQTLPTLRISDNLQKNQTEVTEFIFLGFGELHNLRIPIFLIFLVLHILGLASNALVILLVTVHRSLHSAMYFFLSHLSLCELFLGGNFVPSMLRLILNGTGKISVERCFVQMFLLGVPLITESFLLSSMSFDRYVAICKPLHYAIIMMFQIQLNIAISCWLLGFTISLVLYIVLKKLKFCNLNVIDHFTCDIAPLIQLSCSETYFAELVASLLAVPVLVSAFLLIVVTYTFILRAIFQLSSTTSRKKAFSTCSSHLIVVCVYYGTLSSVYVFPPKQNFVNVNKYMSVLYTLVTPLVNPLVYCLRNQDIRAAILNSVKILKPVRHL